ncbi:MAG TPA: B12-binding domain-containing radical SAM protein, partial [Armatimonadota bacterium]
MAARQYIDKIISRLGSEKGTIHKSHADRLRFAIAFPNTYFVGMSNLGFQTVYGLLNALDDVVCERVFLPDPSDMEDACRIKTGLFTMESQTPVHDFDVLGFSLSYELDYPNALSIMRMSGIPERSAERMGSNYPLIIAGGPAVTFNPEPLAPFVDAFIIGEAEGVISDLADRLLTNRDAGKADQLKLLAQVPGVYVPSLYTPVYDEDGTFVRMEVCEGAPERVRKQWVRDLDEHPTTTVILTPETEFSNMVLSEIARGCGRQCRFCAAGYTYLPPRRRSH